MRVFKNAWFGRFARKEKISAEVLWEAVDRAEKGSVELIENGQFEEVKKDG